MSRAVVLSLALLVPAAGVTADDASVSQAQDMRMKREELVEELRRSGIDDARVLAAIGRVPRHRFVAPDDLPRAYGNHPLAIGQGQTISQPYVVAFMTEAAGLRAGSNVLEVGTGSGYQAAVLAEMLGLGPGGGKQGKLASIEILPALAERSRILLEDLGYDISLRQADGYRGWAERAPFDAILVTAAPDHVPQPLKDQLAVGGRLVIPVGDAEQTLRVITRTETGFREETVLPVRFVPMTGEAEQR